MLTYFSCYMPIHDVAPSAVTIAVATDAMICTINLSVSLLVITLMFVLPTDYTDYTDCHLEHLPPLCHFERSRALGSAALLVQEISAALPLRLPLVLQSGTKRVELLIFLKACEQPKPIELNYEACYISNENL